MKRETILDLTCSIAFAEGVLLGVEISLPTTAVADAIERLRAVRETLRHELLAGIERTAPAKTKPRIARISANREAP